MKPSSSFANYLATGALVCVLFVHPAQAANNTWQGQTGNWSNSSNWTAPITTGDTLVFPIAPIPGGTGVTNLINDSGISSFTGITFTPGTGNYTITSSGTVNYGTITSANTNANRGGAYTFISTYNGSDTVLTLGTSGAVGDGTILNLIPSGGTNGTSNRIVLSSAAAGFMRSRDYFNGADFAWNDTTTNPGNPFVRAINYGVDASTSIVDGFGITVLQPNNHNLVTAASTEVAAATTVWTLKLGGTSQVDISQAPGTILQIGTGFGASAGGIIRSGGGASLIGPSSGTSIIQMSSGTNAYIRTDSASDILVINSNLRNAGGTADNTSNLEKSGTGTLVLGGANIYSGITYILEGTLLVNGSHSAPPAGATNGPAVGSYFVNPGATLGGTGVITLTGANSIQVNGTLSPGNSLGATPDLQTGTLTVANTLMFNNGSNFAVQIGGNTFGSYDQLNLTNAATLIALNGDVTLSLSLVNSYVPVDGDMFFIINQTSAVPFTTLFAGTSEGGTVDLGGGHFGIITYTADFDTQSLTGGTDVAIYLPVPEPAGLTLVALGTAVILFRLRRRI